MSRIVIIENCDDCPCFDVEHSPNMAGTCEKLKRIIPYGRTDNDDYLYPIPDDCPLKLTDVIEYNGMGKKQTARRDWYLENVTKPIYREWLREVVGEKTTIKSGAFYQHTFKMEVPPDPAILPRALVNHSFKKEITNDEFTLLVQLTVYRSILGWRRFLLPRWWKIKYSLFFMAKGVKKDG